MLLSGHLSSIKKDCITGTHIVEISVSDADVAGLTRLYDHDIDIRLEKHIARRSRNANSYFHVLAGKLAELLGVSKPYAKNILLARYGQPMMDSSGKLKMFVSDKEPEEVLGSTDLHAAPVGADGTRTIYQIYRGCHTYNTKEMAILIDGTISELKEMNVDVNEL